MLIALLTSGCAGSSEPAPQPPDPAEAGFPVTVEHGLGTTVVPSPPRRIVAIGGNDGDALFALGLTPVAVLGNQSPSGITPWLAGRIDPAKTTVMRPGAGIDLERIAAFQPDLILAGSVPSIAADYDKLSRIAPTVSYVHGVLSDTWQERLRLTAHAVGALPRAEQIITDTERRIAGVPDRIPGLRGRSISIAWANQPGSLAVVGGDNNTTNLLRALDLKVAPGLRDIQSTTLPNAANSLSPEQWSRLDADIALVAANNPGLAESVRTSPLISKLPAVKRGTYQDIDLNVVSALRVPSALNVTWVIDQITPTLTRAAAAG
ncbi:ABC transporter substrate-binding protein [Pseudonocardia spinosispora]|uniref:ABC transporter substrate-binding protein n=1 Tax=Pseudonocardia spinosispora TaxID=103441 RepID=UPI0012EB46F1|nr:ABC transporter substrate-binding protein [Pseudonocardia spinosispora]